jgi:hypothetical protein
LSDWLGQANGSFAVNSAVNLTSGTEWHVQDPFVHDITPFS